MNVPTILSIELSIKEKDDNLGSINYQPGMTIPGEKSETVFITPYTYLDSKIVKKVPWGKNSDYVFRQFFNKELFYLLLKQIPPEADLIQAIKTIDENKKQLYKPDVFMKVENEFKILKEKEMPLLINNINLIISLLFSSGNYLYVSKEKVYTILKYGIEKKEVGGNEIKMTFSYSSTDKEPAFKIGGAAASAAPPINESTMEKINKKLEEFKHTTSEKKFIENINDLRKYKDFLKDEPIYNYIYSDYKINNVVKIKVNLEVVSGKKTKGEVGCITNKNVINKQIKEFINPPGNVSNFMYEPKQSENGVRFPSSYYGNTSNIDEKYLYNQKLFDKLQKDYPELIDIVKSSFIVVNEVFMNCIKFYESFLKNNNIDDNELIDFFVLEFNTLKNYNITGSKFDEYYSQIKDDNDNIIKEIKKEKDAIKIYFLYKYLFKYDETDYNKVIGDVDEIEETELKRYINDNIKIDILTKYNNDVNKYYDKHEIKKEYLFDTRAKQREKEIAAQEQAKLDKKKQDDLEKKEKADKDKEEAREKIKNKYNDLLAEFNKIGTPLKLPELKPDYNLSLFIDYAEKYIKDNFILGENGHNDPNKYIDNKKDAISNLVYIYTLKYYVLLDPPSFPILNNLVKNYYNEDWCIYKTNVINDESGQFVFLPKDLCKGVALFPHIVDLMINYLSVNYFFNDNEYSYKEIKDFAQLLKELDEFKTMAEKSAIEEDKVYKATILLFIKKYYKIEDSQKIIGYFNKHTTNKIQEKGKYIKLLDEYSPEPPPPTTGGKKKKRMTRKMKKFINLLLKI
jgi:hypothetical protein